MPFQRPPGPAISGDDFQTVCFSIPEDVAETTGDIAHPEHFHIAQQVGVTLVAGPKVIIRNNFRKMVNIVVANIS